MGPLSPKFSFKSKKKLAISTSLPPADSPLKTEAYEEIYGIYSSYSLSATKNIPISQILAPTCASPISLESIQGIPDLTPLSPMALFENDDCIVEEKSISPASPISPASTISSKLNFDFNQGACNRTSSVYETALLSFNDGPPTTPLPHPFERRFSEVFSDLVSTLVSESIRPDSVGKRSSHGSNGSKSDCRSSPIQESPEMKDACIEPIDLSSDPNCLANLYMPLSPISLGLEQSIPETENVFGTYLNVRINENQWPVIKYVTIRNDSDNNNKNSYLEIYASKTDTRSAIVVLLSPRLRISFRESKIRIGSLAAHNLVEMTSIKENDMDALSEMYKTLISNLFKRTSSVSLERSNTSFFGIKQQLEKKEGKGHRRSASDKTGLLVRVLSVLHQPAKPVK